MGVAMPRRGERVAVRTLCEPGSLHRSDESDVYFVYMYTYLDMAKHEMRIIICTDEEVFFI